MKFYLPTLITLCSLTSMAQDNLGINTGNYAGITGISLQPANVADNRYQFDINLVSASINFDNNYLGFSRNYFLNNRFSFKDFKNFEDFKKNVLVENDLKGEKAYLNLNNRLQAPLSFLLTTGKKSGIALNMQSRTSIAFKDINADFAKQVYDFWKYQPTQGQNYDVSGLKMNALNWFEVGLTYGRVLLDQQKHFLKFGVTAKYLGGISSWNLDAKSLSIKADNDSLLTAKGNVNYNHSASQISTKINSNYRPDASSWGGDLGLVYEFRGKIDKFKFLNFNKNTEETVLKTRRDKNKYTLKVGVSLLDVGVLKFKSAPLARDFSINQNGFNLSQIDVSSIKQFDTLISQNVNYTGAEGQQYSVAMPTALSAQVDLHILKGFYVNAMGYVPFKALNKTTTYRIQAPNYLAITPRWESRAAGIYIPVSINSNKVITAGTTLRVGPIFVGTSNFLTLIKKDNIQNADLHAGVKIPLAFGKPSKASKWFKKFTNEEEKIETINNNNTEKIIIKEESNKTAPQTTPQPIQIIINNYNSSNSKKTQEVLTNTNDSTLISVYDDNIDLQKINELQNQIEMLQNKLNQKELLLKTLEESQKDINEQKGSIDSKKKIIDSLQYVYLNDTAFKPKRGIISNSTTLEDRKQYLAKLSTELIELQKRSNYIQVRLSNQSKQIETSLASKNQTEAQRIALKQLKTTYAKLQETSLAKNKIIETAQPIDIAQTPVIASNNQSKNNMSNLVSKNDIENLVSKNDYINLLKEIKLLKEEVRNKTNTNTVAIAPSRGLFKRRNKVINNYYSTVSKDSNQVVKIIRDTIYIEKNIDHVVEKIVRDTIVNTIEKNNTITKTETIDNGRKNVLELAPEVILFDVGQFMIKPIYFSKLTFFASKAKQYSDLKIHISGHTDNTGNVEKNKILSVNRAKAVRMYLIKRGVKSENIIFDADGSDNPIAENTTTSGKSQNRRVELKIMEN